MENEWFYSRRGTRSGPMTAEQVKSLAASGQICPSDLLWRPGFTAWVRAGRFKGLFTEEPETLANDESVATSEVPSSPAETAVTNNAASDTESDAESASVAMPPVVQLRSAEQATSSVSIAPLHQWNVFRRGSSIHSRTDGRWIGGRSNA